jgi:hypothetical protein
MGKARYIVVLAMRIVARFACEELEAYTWGLQKQLNLSGLEGLGSLK